jgi:hypothetical protein
MGVGQYSVPTGTSPHAIVHTNSSAALERQLTSLTSRGRVTLDLFFLPLKIVKIQCRNIPRLLNSGENTFEI